MRIVRVAGTWRSGLGRALKRLAWAVAIASPLAFAACKQGAGDRCQVQSDCADGLLCVLPPAGTPQTGGTCTPPGAFDAAIDLTPTVDLTSINPDLLGADGAPVDM